MFWDTLAVEENSLQKLLKSEENLLLDCILSDPFTLQEIRSGNEKLIEFITKPENLVKIVSGALSPAYSENQEYTEQYKYAHLCSEILTVRNNDFLVKAFLSCEPAIDCLKTNIDSIKQMNHLVASFFMKIVVHILQKNFDMCMQLFKTTSFLEKCLNNLHLGAIGELLQNISKVPSSTDEINEMKQYLVKENLAGQLVGLLDPSLPKAVHDNAADLYIDLIRNLRDILYSCSSNDDILHDSLFTADIITALTDKMLNVDENGPNRSLVINSSEILLCLIETNCVMYCPSHIIETDSPGEDWTAGFNGDTSDQKETILDNERIVETIVAKRSGEIMKMIIDNLENDEKSDLWLYLMRLLVSLCNTNHLPTHVEILEGMRKSEFKKVFSYVYKYPLRSLLQRLVHKIIVYAVYSNTGEVPTPLVSYFFEECNIAKLLINGILPPLTYPRLQFISLRSFHVYLALDIQQSLKNSPIMETLLKYKESDEWAAICVALQQFLEWNKSETDDGKTEFSNSDLLGNSKSDQQPATIDSVDNIREFNEFQTSKRLPSLHTDFLESVERISVEHDTFPDIDVSNNSNQAQAFEDLCKLKDTGSEIRFDDLCSMKSIGIDDWPTRGNEDDDWFSNNTSQSTSEKNTLQESDFINRSLDWPDSDPISTIDNNLGSNDCWADFSSSKNALSSPVKDALPSDDDWPGSDTASPPEMFQAFTTIPSNGE